MKTPQKKNTKFKPGNKAAEKWTPQATAELLNKMWDTVAKDEDGEYSTNPVRANDIKTLGEICLIHDVCPDTWAYIKKKFQDETSVLRIIKKIEWVLENRLIYAGDTMDIFVLKNKYGYADKQQVDHTTKGERIQPSVSPEQIAKLAKEINGMDPGK